jgi:hypothetical protein
MKTLSYSLRVAVAALALATAGASAPAMAGGYYHGGGGGYHGGYYHGGGYGYHGGGCCYNSSAGWWIGGALALAAVGTAIAINSQPTYVGPQVVYAAPPVYAAPVYAVPPAYPVYQAAPAYAPQPAYSAPPSRPSAGDLIAYPARGQTQAQQTRDRGECQNWASNQSGMDPMHITQYTTGVMVDSYNRAMTACMTGKGYSVS